MKHNWTLSTFRQNTWKFVLLNFVCLSPLMFFSRYWLIAVGLMAINIIINIGGAEKIGYNTHYHANYFSILIFVCCDGLVRAYNIFNTKKILATIFVFSSLVLIIPHAATASRKYSWEAENLPIYTLYKRALLGADRNIAKELDLLSMSIPQGSKVSLPEHVMPTFVAQSMIQYFPLGLDNAQYVVVPIDSFARAEPQADIVDNTQPGMLIMYRGREEELKANRCLSKKLVSLGYKEHFKSSNWMILKRAE